MWFILIILELTYKLIEHFIIIQTDKKVNYDLILLGNALYLNGSNIVL